MAATYQDFAAYDTPETEWRYLSKLNQLMEIRRGMERGLEEINESIKFLVENTPEKLRRERFEKLLEAEIGKEVKDTTEVEAIASGEAPIPL